MTRETWEIWADEYQDYWEAKGNYAEEFEQDDIDALLSEDDSKDRGEAEAEEPDKGMDQGGIDSLFD